MEVQPATTPALVPASPRHIVRRRVIAVLLGIIIVVFGYVAVVTNYFGLNTSKKLVLVSSTVAPGGIVTVEELYRHRWPSVVQTEKIHITNSQGQDMNKTVTHMVSDIGLTIPPYASTTDKALYTAFDAGLQAKLPKASGFVDNLRYQSILQYAKKGPGLFFTDTVGCPIGLDNEIGSVPVTDTEKQDFYVLPSTPPGVYTISMKDAYCNLQDAPANETLTFTVK